MTLVNIIESVSPSVSMMRTVLAGFNMFTAGRSNELDLEHSGTRVPHHFFSDLNILNGKVLLK